MDRNVSSTRKLALSGILGALALISLFLAAVLPTSRLSFYAISSFFVSVIVIEYGIKAGWLFYAATGLLSLIAVPGKLDVVPYIIFFGIYGIVKYYVEKLNKRVIEYFFKILYFNVCLLAAFFLIRQVFVLNIRVDLPWWIFIAVLEAVFVVYDYVYTLFIGYYNHKLKKLLKL